MENLALYNKFKEVPETAKKPITAGRLRGFSDINPVWRIKMLTEAFGPCGLGWYYEIVEKELIPGANSEMICKVQISLYCKFDGEWSRPIVGIGGSSFIANEKNGLYTSDECFKMALTDAISVACKALGIGADVYYENDATKYTKKQTNYEREIKSVAEAPNKCKKCRKSITEDEKILSVIKYTYPLCSECQKKYAEFLEEAEKKAFEWEIKENEADGK